MRSLLALLVGFVGARAFWLFGRRMLSASLLLRKNFRGSIVVTAAGLLIVLVVFVVEGLRSVVGFFSTRGDLTTHQVACLVVVGGFGFLGLVDDVLGTDASPSADRERGLAGHARALRQRKITTGLIKLVVGIALGLVAVRILGDVRGWRALVDALLIASTANLINLFDRAPGRATKVGLTWWLVLVGVVWTDDLLVSTAVVFGAALGLLFEDLREHVMLGDTGANVIGAALGLTMVIGLAPQTRLYVLGGVLFLNALSEVVSFSKIIDRIGLLGRLDALGRRH